MSEQENTRTETASSSADDGKTTAIIAYLTIIGLIIAFVLNNDKKNAFASFHIGQMLGLTISAIVLWIIGFIPILGWIILILGEIFLFILWIVGLMNALNAKKSPVPVLGTYYQDWFKNL